jgi:hypothetical protein
MPQTFMPQTFKPGMLVKIRGSYFIRGTYSCMSWRSEKHNTIERAILSTEIGLVIKSVGHVDNKDFLVLFGEKIELVLSGDLECV